MINETGQRSFDDLEEAITWIMARLAAISTVLVANKLCDFDELNRTTAICETELQQREQKHK